MGFRVHGASGYTSFGDEDSYNFNAAGLLVIHVGGPEGARLTYSPHAWRVVEQPDNAGEYVASHRISRE
jgi:hypothetical protein